MGAAEDLKITYGELEELVTALNKITAEFDKASSNADDLANAIDTPYGESKLRDEVHEFEERWNDKREGLNESLKGISEHVQGVIDGFRGGDADLALGLEGEE